MIKQMQRYRITIIAELAEDKSEGQTTLACHLQKVRHAAFNKKRVVNEIRLNYGPSHNVMRKISLS